MDDLILIACGFVALVSLLILQIVRQKRRHKECDHDWNRYRYSYRDYSENHIHLKCSKCGWVVIQYLAPIYRAALEKIAKQELSTEWESEGDTELAYDTIIGVARTALSSNDTQESSHE